MKNTRSDESGKPNTLENIKPRISFEIRGLLFTLNFLLFTSQLHFHQPVSHRNFIIDNIA